MTHPTAKILELAIFHKEGFSLSVAAMEAWESGEYQLASGARVVASYLVELGLKRMSMKWVSPSKDLLSSLKLFAVVSCLINVPQIVFFFNVNVLYKENTTSICSHLPKVKSDFF